MIKMWRCARCTLPLMKERCETRQRVGFTLSHCLWWGEDAQGQKKKRDEAACGIHTALSVYAGKGGPQGYK